MKRLALLVCLLIGTMAAHAQFEKGKWFVNPSVTGLNFSYNTETDKAHFGLEAKGGAFLVDNVALLIDALDEEVGEIGHHRLGALLLQ